MAQVHPHAAGSRRTVAVLLIFSALIAACLTAPTPAFAQTGDGTSSPLPAVETVNAVGMVELLERHQVVLETGGIVEAVAVKVGDQVDAGDLLVTLDTTALEDAVERAELKLESARIALEELTKEPEASDVAVAEAALLQAQEQLALDEAGPTPEELQAAENSAKAAWARYEELRDGPRPAQVTVARAGLAQAEVNLQEAQREYDKIAWLPEAAATDAAENLQRATIAYEAAQASFDETVRPATSAELLGALSGAQDAQSTLNKLLEKPTPADLADARAQVAAAENALDKLTRGPQDADVRSAELGVRQALLDLDGAKRDLAAAEVAAPLAGTVLALNVEPGEQGSSGQAVATLADTSRLNLIVNVEQTDVPNIAPGQEVTIVLYALPDQIYKGEVERIAPTSVTDTGSVTFPVTITMIDDDLSAVRPGMTASATIVVATESAAGSD